MNGRKIEFKYKFYERSNDGLLKKPRTLGPYYDTNNILRQLFDSETEAKQAILNLKEDEIFAASDLILVQEAIVSYMF
jgi:hypothetical protein